MRGASCLPAYKKAKHKQRRQWRCCSRSRGPDQAGCWGFFFSFSLHHPGSSVIASGSLLTINAAPLHFLNTSFSKATWRRRVR
jgi:hypothetical protein